MHHDSRITNALVRRYVPNAEEIERADVRLGYGKLAGYTGLVLNIALAVVKFIAGLATNSVALMGDAANNLSDCGSSLVTLLGFSLSSKPPDREHPYGHGRSEYAFSGLVSLAVIAVAVKLMIDSVVRIFNPEVIPFSPVSIVTMILAILVKLWLYFFYGQLGRKIHSDILRAQAMDSISDVASTGAVFLSLILSPIVGFDLDGYMGLIVSILVIRSGFEILMDNYNSLVGVAPSQEEINRIAKFILSEDAVLDIHDLVLHQYGWGSRFATVHAEVSAKENWLVNHSKILKLEERAPKELGVDLVIHMDPAQDEKESLVKLQEQVREEVQHYQENFDLHDFYHRSTSEGDTIYFDLDIPAEFPKSDEEIKGEIVRRIHVVDPKLRVRIDIDRQVFGPTPRRHWTAENYEDAEEEEEARNS